MLHLTSWMTTLPIMVIGMVSIVLVIGVIVLAVMLLNKLVSRKYLQRAAVRRCTAALVLFISPRLSDSRSGR